MSGKSGYLALLLPFIAFSSLAEGQNASVQITPAGSQAAMAGPAENFTGRVRVDPLFSADSDISASGAYVTFLWLFFH